MGISEEYLGDFSGGVQTGAAVDEFTDRQWSRLDGFVFEDERRLRTQWASHIVHATDEKIEWVTDVDGFLVLVRDTDVLYRPTPDVGTAPGADGWVAVAGVDFTDKPTPRPVGRVPVRDPDGGWQEGLLLNTVEADADQAVVLRRDGTTLVADLLTERYPANTAVEDAMPHGEVSTMWGDFLVLGDIRWVRDEANLLTEANSTRFPNSLWFSSPSTILQWDPIDVEHIGNRTGTNTVVGLFPLDMGLLVVSTDSIDLLRGNPSAYAPETLREDLGAPSPKSVAYWPHANVVVFLDRFGNVWQTNGEEVTRLDMPLPRAEQSHLSAVTAWREYLIVRRGTETWCLRLFERENNSAWTRLLGHSPHQLHSAGDAAYWVNDDRSVRRFDDRAPRDPTFVSRATSRTLGHPHRRTYWHRGGARYRGAGTITQIEWFANRDGFSHIVEKQAETAPAGVAGPIPFLLPYAFDAELVEFFVGSADRQVVAPGPGPTRDVTIGARFRGDVTLESFSVWLHQGSDDR